MTDATASFVARNNNAQAPGTFTGPMGKWEFTYDPNQTPKESSKHKRIYFGTFVGAGRREPIRACALVFDCDSIDAFGIECSNLGHLETMGVGPKTLAIGQRSFANPDRPCPVIIEEDVGENLSTLLGPDVSGESVARILHSAGTPERKQENMKILFDVFVQLSNAHKAGIYHRDLRCENVCVKRFGENPSDIKATVIDFDLATRLSEGTKGPHAPLFQTLFYEIPSVMFGQPTTISPNPLELDMAYLAALQYHLEQDGLLLNGTIHSSAEINDFLSYLSSNSQVSYFAYRRSDTSLQARRLDSRRDITRLAKRLGLTPVDKKHFSSPQLLAYAKSFCKPYLDNADMKACMNAPEAQLAEMIDQIVIKKFETYKELRRKQGLEVPYEQLDQQPPDLQRSNYAQAEHIPVKVYALGYLLVPAAEANSYDEVTSFDDDQVELLARMEHERWIDERVAAGWKLDQDASQSNPDAKTSPYLVPYDELPDGVREYDRDAVRQIIPLIQSAGLRVVRPV